jgi:hypothetical protein
MPSDGNTSHGPLGELKNDEKRAITPRQVDLDKLNMFSVYT